MGRTELEQARIEGLMAQAIYEDLPETDQRTLDEAFAAEPALAKEWEELRALANAIPRERPVLERDLRPAVHARLAGGKRTGLLTQWSVAVAVACAAVIVGAAAFWTLYPQPSGIDVSGVAPVSWVRLAMMQAETAQREGQPGRAVDLLRTAVAEHPSDPSAAEAQYRAASLMFDLGRYPESFDAYTKLKKDYQAYLDEDPARQGIVSNRRDLLDEARRSGYAPLHEWHAALQDRGNEVARLEQVVARYAKDHPRVAEMAAAEMANIIYVNELDGASPESYVTAMKMARERCSNPVAVAQLNLEIGHIYRDDLSDYAVAEEHYRRAAEAPVLAKRAKDALASLAGGPAQ